MPKTPKARSLHSYKLYTRKIADAVDVELSKASVAVLDTIVGHAVLNLVDNASLVKGSSKMLAVSDLRTALQIASANTTSAALEFAETAVQRHKMSKVET
jgi:hypothetical protein